MKIINHALLLSLLYLVGCGSKPPAPTPATRPVDMPSQGQAARPQTPMDVPEWFGNTPEEDDEYLYATGEATSRKMNIAIQKATQQARMNLGQQMSTKVQSLIENMTQEAGMDENVQVTEFYSEAAKSVSNQTLSGAKVLKKYPYMTSGGGYRAYVLMGLKKQAFDNSAAKAITSKVNENKEEAMYAEFKKTQAFNRLEAALDE